MVGHDLAVVVGRSGRQATLGKAVGLDFHWGLLITTLELFFTGQDVPHPHWDSEMGPPDPTENIWLWSPPLSLSPTRLSLPLNTLILGY